MSGATVATRRKKPFKNRAGGIALTLITWVITLGFFFPVAWMVFTAFKT